MELTHLFVAVVSAFINDASIKAWFVNLHGFQSTCVYLLNLVRYTQNGHQLIMELTHLFVTVVSYLLRKYLIVH